MTTKEFKSYLEGYTDSVDVAIRYKLVSLTHPCPDKTRDMDDIAYISYIRGLLTGLTKNTSLDPVLSSHINHLLEIADSVETQISIKIGHKPITRKFWDKYKNDPTPPHWYNEDTIPLNKINRPNPIDIKYHDMNNK